MSPKGSSTLGLTPPTSSMFDTQETAHRLSVVLRSSLPYRYLAHSRQRPNLSSKQQLTGQLLNHHCKTLLWNARQRQAPMSWFTFDKPWDGDYKPDGMIIAPKQHSNNNSHHPASLLPFLNASQWEPPEWIGTDNDGDNDSSLSRSQSKMGPRAHSQPQDYWIIFGVTIMK